MNSNKATFLMVTVSLAWGMSYLLMKIGLSGIEPFNLIGLRFGIAFIAMILLSWKKFIRINKPTIKYGLLMGGLLFLIFSSLVIGVKYTPASTAGFLASTTVVFVPIIESIVNRKKPSNSIFISIFMSTVGLYLLTANGNSLHLGKGAFLCILTAILYASYIIILDFLACKKEIDLFLVSIIQLGVTSLMGWGFSTVFERPSLPNNSSQWLAILALGIFCSAYGFVVQPMSQKYLSAVKIGLIFSLEPVFSALLSFLFIHEVLEIRGYFGALLILISILYAQFSSGKKTFKDQNTKLAKEIY
ncbi:MULTISPECIES: DMT family transporter [unclassified Enterococcus]|uniref:DMT family transporter n=1 Tax=unclassified Enterococcus TaxID=2608891 RepID=UPI0015536AC8|nr:MULTISPECIES: DMT family transporter [unclassified Enterococcus]MBS7576907.1 EamA family transporter [Enterococcus sp. MMGLQ5-2]MBS7584314.1 EamA family transporter [Enterococcus sp. MMGLQ5-1]NPD12170.1 EamA family transporter [Enterococcus sp. MMGLQ5-1]NPD36742.1 EamA family transporter [Enterococcus sp. MMGLQ5-2]